MSECLWLKQLVAVTSPPQPRSRASKLPLRHCSKPTKERPIQTQLLGAPRLTVDGVSDELAVRLPLAVGLAELVSELEAVDDPLGVALADGVCARARECRQGLQAG